MASDSTERILSGRSWEDFCDRLRDAGEVVLRDATPMDAFDRAEGYRYLSRLTRVALESYIEAADPRAPVLRRPSHESVKIGADNPDNHYQSAAISGAYEYRLSGTRGTVHYLGFGTYAGNYGSDARMGQSGYLEAADIEIGPLSSSLCHLGNIATRVGRVLEFDPKREQIVGDDEANALVTRKYSDHWGRPNGV